MEKMEIQVCASKKLFISWHCLFKTYRTCLSAVLRLVVHNDRPQWLEQVQQAWIVGLGSACTWWTHNRRSTIMNSWQTKHKDELITDEALR
jgi:hypothetical protein